MAFLTYKQAQLVRPNYELTNGLILWWPLFDGTANDYSGNNRNGTIERTSAGPLISPGFVRNYINANSLGFNDAISGEGIYLANASYLNPSRVTAACWFNSRYLVGDWRLVNKWADAAADGSFMLLTSNDKAYFIVENGETYYTPTISTTISTNRWYHLCGTFDGSIASTYLNGTLIGSIGSAVMSTTSISRFYVARGGNLATQRFNGRIQDVRLYDRALSAAEVHTLYASSFQSVLDFNDDTLSSIKRYRTLNIPMLGM